MGATDCILIEHTTSGDVTGDKGGYIVGYSSFIISKIENDDDEILSKDEKVFLLDVARKSVNAAVNGNPIPESKPLTKRLKEPRGLFVTLTKKGKLRGCIGYIQAIKPLFQAVSEMAVSAALKDPRFPSVSSDELSQLSIEISVLSPLEKIDNPEVIKVGRDGIFIKKGIYSGLLLPQVATEYGWDRKTFLEETCRKAGLPSNAYKEPDTEIFIFQALIFNEEEL
ncbi:AmmeMemoRadiSam system protein A [candidate division WOR-3 bacterium]|nr:AmmeMemoRadiSam system protein A [candidate division WOR-3 bacterium]